MRQDRDPLYSTHIRSNQVRGFWLFPGFAGGGGGFILPFAVLMSVVVCVLVSLQIMCLSIWSFNPQVTIKPLKCTTRACGHDLKSLEVNGCG